ncbi:hypothetical protein [Acetobacterium sp.]|uniref:hypothetical protein n=1 Tax=Acetobacterium sp. TaxID=1872094 RepID=UPI0027219695|nr:hypothetical protein [Acetobacterium sp.]MDO9492333.1 hypothetical protein [Acetobacterium sp.]
MINPDDKGCQATAACFIASAWKRTSDALEKVHAENTVGYILETKIGYCFDDDFDGPVVIPVDALKGARPLKEIFEDETPEY